MSSWRAGLGPAVVALVMLASPATTGAVDADRAFADAAGSAVRPEARSRTPAANPPPAARRPASDPASTKGVITTASGLRFQTLVSGQGPRPRPSDVVRVMYVGRLSDGTVFDRSEDLADFWVMDVVPGFSEALQLMSKGGEYQFWVPPRLAYGATGAGAKVPPNAELEFRVTLFMIVPPALSTTSAPNGPAVEVSAPNTPAPGASGNEQALREIFARDLQAETLVTQGRYRQAELMYREVLQSRVAILGERDPASLGALNGVALALQKQGRFVEAEPLFRKGLRLVSDVLGERDPHALISLSNLATNLGDQGRHAEADLMTRKALQLQTEVLGERHPDTLITLGNLAVSLSAQGRYVEAEPLTRKALRIKTEVLGERHSETLLSLSNLATRIDRLGRHREAEPLHRKALLLQSEVLGEGHPDTLTTLSNLTTNLNDQGRYAEAEPLARQALELRGKLLGAVHPDTVLSLSVFAQTLYFQGRYGEAELWLANALQFRTEALGALHPDTLGSASDLAAVRLKLPGRTDALDPARLAVAGWRARNAAQGVTARDEAQIARDASSHRDVYLTLAQAAWRASMAAPEQAGSLGAEALMAVQDYMAGPASQALAQSAARNAAESDHGLGALARRRQELSDNWRANDSAQTRALGENSDEQHAASLPELAVQQRDIEAEIVRIDARFQLDFPDYFALVRPAPLGLQAAQKLLNPDEALLVVAPSPYGTHVMAVTRDGFKWAHSDWDKKTVSAAVRRLLWDAGGDVGVDAATELQWQNEGGAGFPYDRKTAYALYQQIVTPVGDLLAGKRQVFIAAGGVLTSLPFGILVTEPPRGADGDPKALRATSWFAEAHALTVIPSIQSLQFLRSGARSAATAGLATGFAGYGDPLLDGGAQTRGARSSKAINARSVFGPAGGRSGAAVADISQLKLLARLPGTAVELADMRAALQAPLSSIHVQGAASESAIKSADLTRVGILVFATHGLMAGELHGVAEPGLVFTPPTQASERDDGLLTASEVAGLKLNADWVILSACNTAAGDGSEGAPGLSGLARAFFYAGARNLLVSHWPVRDDVASRLTVETIRLQRANPRLPRAEALQQATRSIRNDATHDTASDTWAHPSAWAPFSLIGDGAVARFQ